MCFRSYCECDVYTPACHHDLKMMSDLNTSGAMELRMRLAICQGPCLGQACQMRYWPQRRSAEREYIVGQNAVCDGACLSLAMALSIRDLSRFGPEQWHPVLDPGQPWPLQARSPAAVGMIL